MCEVDFGAGAVKVLARTKARIIAHKRQSCDILGWEYQTYILTALDDGWRWCGRGRCSSYV